MVNLELKFTPKHMVYGDSYILMQLPDLIDFSCLLVSNSTSLLKTAPTCEELEPNLIRFSNPFADDFYAGDESLSIVFENRVLPGSNEMIQGITIETYMTLDFEDYLVDKFEDRSYRFFAPT